MGKIIRVVIVDTNAGQILVPEESAHGGKSNNHNPDTCPHGEIDHKNYNRYLELLDQIKSLEEEAYTILDTKVVLDHHDCQMRYLLFG